ncbi:MAG: hypothetical protein LM580_02355 [Thermofilum sp.]|nr:hypothetical protein [Thermofilum sp.]
MRGWRVAYAVAVCALLAYALSGYPGAAARYADFWGGVRVNPLDARLLRPALLYAVEREGGELRVLVLRTYALPEARNAAVTVRVFGEDEGEGIFVFGERAPPGRLLACVVHAPAAVHVRVEVEVDGARVVEERWLGGP